MRFSVVTYGTEGDTRPLAALCRALMNAGHETLMLADVATLGFADSLGVPTSALAGDIRKALMPGAALSNTVKHQGGFTSTASTLASIANANTEAWMRQIATASVGCDAIIVSGLAAFVGLSVAEYHGIPAIGSGLIPITPTREFASPFLRPGMVPHWLNRLSHRFVNGVLWHAFRKSTNAARAAVCGLAPRGQVWTDHPMLYGVSRYLVPRPRDWSGNAYLCGQWALPSPNWVPPKTLSEFLGAGEPPIYVGFGSMAGFDRQRLLSELVAGVAGRRALFYPGWSGVDASGLPGNFHVVGDTPHSWLFPRTSLVMHHGGAGTTHSAAGAGVPSVVVPFAGDQFFWADRLRQVGAASAPVGGKDLNAARLARGIEYAETDEARSRASELGEKMSAESGLATAISVIERQNWRDTH
jgi:sterol 3beta-glucosyltransferase